MKKRLYIILALILAAAVICTVIFTSSSGPVFEGRLGTSNYAIDVIKELEGFTATANDQNVIGYGCSLDDAKTYGFEEEHLTEKQAENLLLYVICDIEKHLDDFLAAERIRLNQHQYDAMVLFTIDHGTSWMTEDSPLGTVLTARSYTPAEFSNAMAAYLSTDSTEAETTRRIRETAMFLYSNYYEEQAVKNISVLHFMNEDGIPEAIGLYPTGIAYQTLRSAENDAQFAGWYTESGEKITAASIVEGTAEVYARYSEAAEDPELTQEGEQYTPATTTRPTKRQFSVVHVVISALNKGFVTTLKLFAVTLLGALPLGLIISFGSMSKFAPLKYLTKTIVWIFRGSPLLLQLMIVFYMPGLLFKTNPWAFADGRFWAAATAFILNYACYFSEIFRGGIESVPTGQTEAGLVLGMTKSQIFFKVTLMQLIKRILPPISNEIITLVKDTSLANTIALAEVIMAGERFMKSAGLVWPLFFTGVYYLAFTGILTLFLGWLERKLNYFRV